MRTIKVKEYLKLIVPKSVIINPIEGHRLGELGHFAFRIGNSSKKMSSSNRVDCKVYKYIYTQEYRKYLLSKNTNASRM